MAARYSIRSAARTSYSPMGIFPRIPQKLKAHRVARGRRGHGHGGDRELPRWIGRATRDSRMCVARPRRNGLSNQRRNLRVVPILNLPLDEASHVSFRIDERMLGQLRRALHA